MLGTECLMVKKRASLRGAWWLLELPPTLRSGEGGANLARDDGRGHLHCLAVLGGRGGLAGDDGGGHLHGLPAPLHHRGGHLHALPRAVLHRGGRTTVTSVQGKPKSPLRTLLQVKILNRQMRFDNATRATIEVQAGIVDGEPQPLLQLPLVCPQVKSDSHFQRGNLPEC
jgi:hypothetical protein